MIDMNVVGGFPMQMAVASIPSAASLPNYTSVWLTDVGTGGGSEWYAFNGEWYPKNPVELNSSAVPVSVTGTTIKTVVRTFTIPGKLMGANGKLRIVMGVTLTNSANSKGALIEIDGTTVFASPFTNILTYSNTFDIVNVNSESSQFCTGRGASGGHGNTTAVGFSAATSINTAVNNTLDVSFTLASAGDTATLNYLAVSILK